MNEGVCSTVAPTSTLEGSAPVSDLLTLDAHEICLIRKPAKAVHRNIARKQKGQHRFSVIDLFVRSIRLEAEDQENEYLSVLDVTSVGENVPQRWRRLVGNRGLEPFRESQRLDLPVRLSLINSGSVLVYRPTTWKSMSVKSSD